MTECRSPELQDLLPDYVADGLDDVSTARIAAHLSGCVTCADDVAVLRLVRRARPQVAMPDVARIVAALPPASGGSREAGAHASVHPLTVLAPPPSMRQPARRGVAFGLSPWRLAATLALIIAGGASLTVARTGTTGSGTVAVGESGAAATTGRMPSLAETVAVASPAILPTVSVSYGDLDDYSEDELQRMLERLDRWDGATSTEPLPGVPILPAPGGGTP